MLSVDLREPVGIAQFSTYLKQFEYELRVAIPAIVVSFDAAKQTIVAQPAVKEMMRVGSVPTPVKLPQLLDVPIVLPRAGGFTLTLPIKAGDEVLILFGDMCFDAWWQSGGTENVQPDKRRHDLSDGFAILAPWSQPRVLPNYSTNSAQLRSDDGNTYVDVQPTAITVHAQTVNVAGSTQVNVTSNTKVEINGNGTTHIEGKNFLTHTHTGVQTGGGTTGPVA